MHEENFRALFNFIGSWFPDADLEGQSDEMVLKKFLETAGADELRRIEVEGTALLASPSFPTERLAAEANRSLGTEAEAREWLGAILRAINEEKPGNPW